MSDAAKTVECGDEQPFTIKACAKRAFEHAAQKACEIEHAVAPYKERFMGALFAIYREEIELAYKKNPLCTGRRTVMGATHLLSIFPFEVQRLCIDNNAISKHEIVQYAFANSVVLKTLVQEFAANRRAENPDYFLDMDAFLGGPVDPGLFCIKLNWQCRTPSPLSSSSSSST
jgi:hypothetical protein